MQITTDQIKELRGKTKAGVMDCRRALLEAEGDLQKACQLLRALGLERAEKKSGRQVCEGVVESYIHSDRRIGVILELGCETDFVARTDDFKYLAHDLAMQVAAAGPQSVDQLLDQEFIKDTSLTVKDVLVSAIARLGENIVVRRFERFEVGA